MWTLACFLALFKNEAELSFTAACCFVVCSKLLVIVGS